MPSNILEDKNITKLLIKMSVPAMTGMFVMATYNIVDMIFIGRFVGPMAIASILILAPFNLLIFAISTMIGVGGASIYSRLLGAKRTNLATFALTNVIRLSVVLGAFITIISFFEMENILSMLGTNEKTYIYAKNYFSINLWGTLPLIFSISLNNIARAEGRAKLAMGTMFVSALINLLLDSILIVKYNMGVRGAAYATIIAELLTATYLIMFFIREKGNILLKRVLSFKKKKATSFTIKQIFTVGLSSFLNQMSASVMVLILNSQLIKYGGNIAVTVFAIFHRTSLFIFMPIYGIAQGMQPIAGFNFGAKKYKKTIEVIFSAIRFGTVFATFGFILLIFFPNLILSIFTSDTSVLAFGKNGIRILGLAFPLIPFYMMGSVAFQSLGKPVPALILIIMRQLVILVPLILILPYFFNISGIWFSIPLADFLSFTVVLILLNKQIKKLKKLSLVEVI